jgi:hypothetical protein
MSRTRTRVAGRNIGAAAEAAAVDLTTPVVGVTAVVAMAVETAVPVAPIIRRTRRVAMLRVPTPRVRMRRAAKRSPVRVRTVAEITVEIAMVAMAVAVAVAVADTRAVALPAQAAAAVVVDLRAARAPVEVAAAAVQRVAVNPAVGMAAASPA